MQVSRQKLLFMQKMAIVGAIFLVLFVAGYYTGYIRKDCGQDAYCFDTHAQSCRASAYIEVKNNNVYTYHVWPGVWGTCKMKVTLSRVGVGVAPEYLPLEGTSMTCEIPKELLDELNMRTFDNLFQYCHGILKEKLYEIVITRMYEKVVSQLGTIAFKVEDVLRS